MSRLPSLELLLGTHRAMVDRQVEAWIDDDVPARLAARDPNLWPEGAGERVKGSLGWLGLPFESEERLGDWTGFAAAEREAGIDRVLLLGMGGSSLAPEVFERILGRQGVVEVLDSTHPRRISQLAESLDVERTLILVSSKSGTTIETRSLFEFFWKWVGERDQDPGRRFVVLTDSGTELEKLARGRSVHRLISTPGDVGGRFSALSAFGLVPAALSGVDPRPLLTGARRAIEALATRAGARPLLALGASLAGLASAGRDKLTLLTSDALEAFPDWLEQLIAESTGKHGLGIVPVVGESMLPASRYGPDRTVAAILLAEDRGGELERHVRALAERGVPVMLFFLREPEDLGFELMRWEIAVSLAGSALELNPFDQPDVELAKRMARAALEAGGDVAVTGGLVEFPLSREGASRLESWLPGAPSYVAIQAFLARDAATDAALRRLRRALRASSGSATTIGYGPRYLHSTGQLHKGGPAVTCLQLVDASRGRLEIPGEEAGFDVLIGAQADGDAAALIERGRSVGRLTVSGVEEIESMVTFLEEV